MNRNAYSSADYRQPNIPPATPPVIAPGADAGEAATLAESDGDSNAPGSQPAHFERGREDQQLVDGSRNGGGDRDFPGEQPDEIVPGQGDNEVPGERPDEVAPDQGDFDQPDSSPIETPPPMETPPPPD